jgi:hypothetical protein
MNVRHFHEKLGEEHRIGLSYTWVKQALQGAGLVMRKSKRGVHRRRRERRSLPGMMLHIDVSHHQWFQDERWHDLIVILDDANSEIYYAQLVKEETTATVMVALREVMERLERGITIRKGPSHLTAQLQGVLEDAYLFLSGRLRLLILELKHEWDELDQRIENSNAELQRIAKQDDACHRLMEIPGFGPLVSTALVAAIGNGITFRKGRDLSAWLGLVPRQHSTGGKTRLLGISKRGNEYLRRMLLHGARSVVAQIGRTPSALGLWLSDLSARSHRNVTVVVCRSQHNNCEAGIGLGEHFRKTKCEAHP